MTQVYNVAKKDLFNGDLDFATDDIRVRLLMTNTTADTENDGVNFVGDFTTLDHCNDSGYSEQALTTETVTQDDANDRAIFDADDVTFTNNGDASRDIAGVLVYRFVTNDADSVPIAFLTLSGTLDGNDFEVRWDSAGLITLS